MKYPKISTVSTKPPYMLLVEFDNQEKREYDVANLLKNKMFAPLQNPVFFKTCKIDPTGYAVVWNEDIDISEYELWQNGKPIA